MGKILIVPIIVLVFLVGIYRPLYAQDAQIQFEKAKELIKQNCADCMGATRQGLENGISSLNESIRSGYKNKKEAYILLRDAYNTMRIVYATPSSEEQRNIRREIKIVNEKLVQIDPNDPKILYEYARYLDDSDAQLQVYEIILKIDPDDVDARFASGKIMIEKGNVNEGIAELRETLRRAKGQEYENYGKRTVEILKQYGHKDDANEIEKKLHQK
jgi:tetratricopeptide (TPR) repeat protein